tara:strand:+ start:379 stop:528 length:150 start_codon:yes stop_codon:yes gene_type:complete
VPEQLLLNLVNGITIAVVLVVSTQVAVAVVVIITVTALHTDGVVKVVRV